MSTGIFFNQPGGAGGPSSPGFALFATNVQMAHAVTVAFSPTTGVVRAVFEVTDVPPGSAVTTGVVQDGPTLTWPFTPDKTGGYRLHVQGYDAGGNLIFEDFRVFQVGESSGRIIPPFAARGSELNFTIPGAGSPNARGWSPFQESYDRYADTLASLGTARTRSARRRRTRRIEPADFGVLNQFPNTIVDGADTTPAGASLACFDQDIYLFGTQGGTNGKLFHVDAITGTANLLATMAGGKNPHDVVGFREYDNSGFDGFDYVAALSDTQFQLFLVTPTTGSSSASFAGSFAGGRIDTVGEVNVSNDGSFIWSAPASNIIYATDIEGSGQATALTLPGGSTPTVLCADPLEHVWIYLSGKQQVARYTFTSTTRILTADNIVIDVSAGGFSIFDMVCDGERLYTLNSNGDFNIYNASTGVLLRKRVGFLPNVWSFSRIIPDDLSIWLTDDGDVTRCDPDNGDDIGGIFTPDGGPTRGGVVNEAGVLYVAVYTLGALQIWYARNDTVPTTRRRVPVRTCTSTTTNQLTSLDEYVEIDSTTAGVIVLLPAPGFGEGPKLRRGDTVHVKWKKGGNTAKVDPQGVNIEGSAAQRTITPLGHSEVYRYNGTEWSLISS